MAVTRRTYGKKKRSGSKKTRNRVAVRKAGGFGLYRGTSAMSVGRRAATLYRTLNPFPNSKLCRHKYVDSCIYAAGGGAGLPTVYQFRANSLYDPDFTGVGHQPMFRDEMAAQYNYYTVLSSRIKIEIPPTNGNTINYALWCDTDSAVPTDPNTAMEQHASKMTRTDKRHGPLVLTGWYDAAKWEKTTRKALLTSDDHKIAKGSNPNTFITKFYNLYVAPLAATVTLPAADFKVTITYIALWREPVDHIGS